MGRKLTRSPNRSETPCTTDYRRLIRYVQIVPRDNNHVLVRSGDNRAVSVLRYDGN